MAKPDDKATELPTKPPHLLHIFPSFAVGGQQVRFASIANRLGRRYRHTVLSLDGAMTARELFEAAAPVVVEPSVVSPSRFPNLRRVRDFASIVRRHQPDLLLTYNWGAVEWGLANRLFNALPHLHFEDGFGVEESAKRQLRRRVWFRRIALGGRRTRIVVPSRQLHDIATRIWGFDRGKVAYVPNGIDCERFVQPPDPRLGARIGTASGTLVVGTVGAHRPEKNLARLIRGFAALANECNLRLVIAGDGPERDALERLAGELGVSDRVGFLGHVRGAEKVLGHLDIFAVSSDTEQMPYSVMEAMAAGLPIVATDVGDIRAMVAEENRTFICPLGDERRFVEAMQALLCDGECREQLGRLNRIRVRKEYDLDLMIARHEALLAECLRVGPGDASPQRL